MTDWPTSNFPQDPGAVDGIELAPGVRVPESAIRVQYSRSGGPGGQNVNKLNTKAEIWIAIGALSPHLSERVVDRLVRLAGKRLTAAGDLHFSSETHRSQEQNRQAAFERLRVLLVQAMTEPRPRKKTKPSRAAKQRRLDHKKRRSQIKARRQGRDS